MEAGDYRHRRQRAAEEKQKGRGIQITMVKKAQHVFLEMHGAAWSLAIMARRLNSHGGVLAPRQGKVRQQSKRQRPGEEEFLNLARVPQIGAEPKSYFQHDNASRLPPYPHPSLFIQRSNSVLLLDILPISVLALMSGFCTHVFSAATLLSSQQLYGNGGGGDGFFLCFCF